MTYKLWIKFFCDNAKEFIVVIIGPSSCIIYLFKKTCNNVFKFKWKISKLA